MAVDYYHRLIVSGPADDLKSLRAGLVTNYVRVVGGEQYKERLPFSFAGLFALAPGAKRCQPRDPMEPYDIRVWPIGRGLSGEFELRYQLHTRNADLVGFVRVLSRKLTSLTFQMATLCLDDSEIVAFLVREAMVRRCKFPNYRRDFHWDLARRKFDLQGDDVYDDDDADRFAEDGMLDEAMNQWTPPRREWWDRPVVRDFMEQRALDVIQASEVAAEFDREERRQRRRRKKGLTSIAAASGAPPGRLPHVVEQTRESLDAEARSKPRRHKRGKQRRARG